CVTLGVLFCIGSLSPVFHWLLLEAILILSLPRHPLTCLKRKKRANLRKRKKSCSLQKSIKVTTSCLHCVHPEKKKRKGY
ncbi:hypothetical protein EDC94DRAFT_609546, partial [Helicostylum pulchrum]